MIGHDNNVKQSLNFFDMYPECTICSVPWIVSDFKMDNMYLAPQYFQRTPGVGSYDARSHVKMVLENGRLPFVCTQSNFLRVGDIRNSQIEFDNNYPITSDGIFLSKLALQNNQVCFFNKYSIIWRYDAPNRLHSNMKYHDHIKQFYNAFIIIDSEVNLGKKGIAKALANYGGAKYFLITLIKSRSKTDFNYSFELLGLWFSLVKKGNIDYLSFIYHSALGILKSIKKIPTLFRLSKFN